LSSLKIQTSNVFERNYNAPTKLVINQGGTRSGKTYSLCQLLIVKAFENTGKRFSIVRKSLPSLKLSVMKDFFEILTNLNLYDETNHNKSDHTYNLNGNTFEFISLDQPQKKRGAKRHFLFCNEANELTWEDFFQLLVRTEEKIYIDYNPSDSHHWIYDKVLTREDCTFIKSTYRDNPFLAAELVKEIERLRDTDDEYWKVYGLGERGFAKSIIFPKVRIIGKVPDEAKLISTGMDFGFTNDPTTIVEVYEQEDNLIFNELVYERGLTNGDVVDKLALYGFDRRRVVFADSAEPKSIEEIYRLGYNVKPAAKGKDSINIGIDLLKRYKLQVTAKSSNIISEFNNYKWQEDKNGNLLNKPIDKHNHSIDAIRYAVTMVKSKPNVGRYSIR
jgi:phage terminase large subunit